MARRSGRPPNPHERALWDRVVADATPLPKRPTAGTAGDTVPGVPRPALAPKPPRTATRIPEGFAIGARRDSVAPPAGPGADLSGRAAPKMDRKLHARLVRGKLVPEARLDLHGMTLAAAKPALTRFLVSAAGDGKRLVLVITGKGRDRDPGGPIPLRAGALRHEVPQWLAAPPLSSVVLDVAPAHRRHGGSGALYVYLRRAR